ncbi:glycoside hydrolase family 16 protein [Quadrisphaera sp. KR29]|uniref:glycoside hydrolase family 16 protein n=1 Tax=Quadrisphaera sp. KR29 TaxID=3461391 RepID=UPI0040446154
MEREQRVRGGHRPARAAVRGGRSVAVAASVLVVLGAGALLVAGPGGAGPADGAAAPSSSATSTAAASAAPTGTGLPGRGPTAAAQPGGSAGEPADGAGGAPTATAWTAAVHTRSTSGVRASSRDSAAAASAALPAGDLPGWRQVFTDGFDDDVAEGAFTSSGYGDRWHAYDGFPDTFGVGAYSDDLLSVSGGALQMRWHTQDGVPRVSGLVPLVDGRWGGHVGGRYSVRFRASAGPAHGYNAAFLVWPDSNVWAQGELDFAEGALDGGVRAYHHCPGDPQAHCASAESTAPWEEWHVATLEWTERSVTYSLDGVRLMTSTDVPVDPMHLVLQGYVSQGYDPARDATVQVDWVAVWYPDGG